MEEKEALEAIQAARETRTTECGKALEELLKQHKCKLEYQEFKVNGQLIKGQLQIVAL